MDIQQRRTLSHIGMFKEAGRKLVCLTSYTAPVARIADRHADLILVGDSLGMALYGFDNTLPVTLDMMTLHGRAVVQATEQAFITVDMPFGSYQESPEQAFRNAARLMAETGCGAVKLEGGIEMAETVAFLTRRGVPVMGHIGLQPQSVNMAGGYRVSGRGKDAQAKIMDSAKALEQAGAFAVVLECMEEALAASVTTSVSIPTIGIGASAACTGQILVAEDILGLTPAPHPRFVKQYADLNDATDRAFKAYAEEVRKGRFPASSNVYGEQKDGRAGTKAHLGA